MKRARRAWERALEDIIYYEPESKAEALMLLEFAGKEPKHTWRDTDDICIIIENWCHALSIAA